MSSKSQMCHFTSIPEHCANPHLPAASWYANSNSSAEEWVGSLCLLPCSSAMFCRVWWWIWIASPDGPAQTKNLLFWPDCSRSTRKHTFPSLQLLGHWRDLTKSTARRTLYKGPAGSHRGLFCSSMSGIINWDSQFHEYYGDAIEKRQV